jgi:hypothetical protein
MPSEAHAQQLIPAEPGPIQHIPAEPAPINMLAVIARAASDPSVDVDKMKQLLDVHERMTATAAKLEYDRAMSAAQAAMRPIATDANNPSTKSKYASYFALDNAIRPFYTKHGFALSFDTAPGAGQDMIRVVCKVSHVSGHREFPQLDMPADGKGAKGGDVMTKTHATGSAITYGKRYLLQMVFNLAVGGDDDGNAAGPGGYISAEQKAELVELLRKAGAVDPDGPGTAKFLKIMRVSSLDEIAACNFNRARNTLLETINGKGGK